MKILNDVLGYPLKIYQDSDYFCFSLDSVILATQTKIKIKDKNILELGTGNGIVPLLLSTKTNNKIRGIEIQKDLYDMAKESVIYNSKENQIELINQDMLEFAKKSEYDKYDLILSNPPYFKNVKASTKNDNIHKTIARHEVKINLEQIVQIASNLLKEKGRFVTVNRVDRLLEVIELYKKYRIEPKYIRFVHDTKEKEPSIFYLEGIKYGNIGLKVDKPLILYNEDGTKTEEYLQIEGEKYETK